MRHSYLKGLGNLIYRLDKYKYKKVPKKYLFLFRDITRIENHVISFGMAEFSVGTKLNIGGYTNNCLLIYQLLYRILF